MSGSPRSITPRTAGMSSEARCAASSRHASKTQIVSRSSWSWLTTYSSQPSTPCNSPAAAMSRSTSSPRRPGWATSLPTMPNRAITLPFADASHPWPGSGRVAAEHRRCRRPDLLGRHVAEVLGEPPSVAEGVEDLPVTVAPDISCKGPKPSLPPPGPAPTARRRRRYGRPGRPRCPPPTAARAPQLGELIGEHHRRVAKAQLDLHEPAAGHRDAAALLGPECPLIPRRGGRV